MMTLESVSERFWTKVEKGPKCWNWLGAVGHNGYGIFGINYTAWEYAHRMAWFLTYGNIPFGMLVCHHCDNKICTRPDHLFLGTHKDNTQDASRKGRLRGGSLKGEENPNVKLTWHKVRKIRKNTTHTLNQLANTFGVSLTTIKRIRYYQNWRE